MVKHWGYCDGSGACEVEYDAIAGNKVCYNNQEIFPTSAGNACDRNTNYFATVSDCTYEARYSACNNGGNNCDEGAGTFYASTTVNVPVNKIAITTSGGSSVPTADATTDTRACNTPDKSDCDNGDCSAVIRRPECTGSGSCDNDASDNYQAQTVYANAGYTLTTACSQTGTTLCNSADACVDVS